MNCKKLNIKSFLALLLTVTLVLSATVLNAANKEQKTVIIVSAITGTVLLDQENPKNQLWPLTIDFWRDLEKLRMDDNGKPLYKLKQNGLVESIYGELRKSLNSGGYKVYDFCYDWRQSNGTTAKELESFINNLPAQKVDLVSYSMGAMIVTKYLEKNYSKVDKYITIGAPFYGATNTLYNSHSGKYYSWLAISTGAVKRLMRNMPSSYELYPVREYFDGSKYSTMDISIKDSKNKLKESRCIRSFEEAGEIFKKMEVINPKLFDEGVNFTQSLNYVETLKKVKTYFIIGDGIKSYATLHYTLKENENGYKTIGVERINEINGDFTVPLFSATMGGKVHEISPNGVFYVNEKHIGLTWNKDVLRLVNNLLEGQEGIFGSLRNNPLPTYIK